MKKILAFLFIVFITVVANAGQRPTSNALVVGLEATYAPFNWTETRASCHDTVDEKFRNHPINGSVSWFGRGLYANGYDVWIARQIANDLGKDLVIEQIVWEGLVPALQLGHIDLIVAGMTPTPARSEVINFSDEYHQVRNVPVVRRDSRFATATSISDLEGARIVAQRNTVFDTLAGQLADIVNGTHSVPLDNVPAVLSNISAGANDITVLEYAVAMTLIGTSDDAEFMILELDDLNFSVHEFQERLGIGVRKGEDYLLYRVNQTLANFHQFLYYTEPTGDTFLDSRATRAEWMERSIEASLRFQGRLF